MVCTAICTKYIHKLSRIENNVVVSDADKGSHIKLNIITNKNINKDSKILLVIRNDSSFPVIYGDNYILEYYDNIKRQWEKVKYKDINVVFNLVSMELKPYSSDTLDIYIYPKHYEFISGKYRIIKSFNVKNRKLVLKHCFFIKNDSIIDSE